MTDELLELERLRADLPPADEAAMARARATLVHTATSAPARRRRFPVRIATTATVGAAAVAAFLIVPGAGDNAPTASAVTLNGDGTVTIELTDITDMPAANKVLIDAGIRAELLPWQDKGKCEPGAEPASPLSRPDGLLLDPPTDARNVVTFRPDRIPAGTELVVFGVMATWTNTKGTAVETGPSVVASAQLYPENSGTCVDAAFDYIYLLPVPESGN
jgi:hypothetical protein